MVLPDEGVDLDGVNIVELLDSILDLTLVGLEVDNEDQCVVLLNLLHGALGVEWVDDALELVEAVGVWDSLAWVLWLTGELEGLWAVESGRCEDSLVDLSLHALESGLAGSGGLCGWAYCTLSGLSARFKGFRSSGGFSARERKCNASSCKFAIWPALHDLFPVRKLTAVRRAEMPYLCSFDPLVPF